MTRSKSQIYWREESQSFLPEFDKQEITELLNSEFSRHAAGFKAGTIVGHREYTDKHVIQKFKDNTYSYEVKKGSEHILSDHGSFQLTDQFLHELLGTWIGPNFVLGCVYSLRNPETFETPLPKDQHSKAIELVFSRLDEFKKHINERLIRFRDQVSEESLELGDPTDSLSEMFENAVQETLRSTDAMDRWFDDLCDDLVLYSESIGITITFDKIDNIADKHFQSWMYPNEGASAKFADELAAYFVTALFEQKYGDPDP